MTDGIIALDERQLDAVAGGADFFPRDDDFEPLGPPYPDPFVWY
jgi:hypothetical protein